MACLFVAKDCECEGCHEDDAVGTYRVDEKQKLCNSCATIKRHDIKKPKETSILMCVKHQDKGAKLFCETHTNVICTACAATDTHKSCSKKDIQDAIDERKDKLTDLIRQGEAKGNKIKDYDSHLTERAKHVADHLAKVEKEVNASILKKMKNVTDKQELNATKINQEADDEIAKINERRNEGLKLLQQEDDDELEQIDAEKETLIKNIALVTETTDKILREMKTTLDSYLKNLAEKIEITRKLSADENCILSEAQNIVRSFIESLGMEFNMEKIDKVSSMVDKVSFVNGVVAIGECTLEQEEELPLGLSGPTMVGTTDKDEVVFTNKTGSIHVKNVNNKITKRVLRGKNQVRTCASLNDGTGRTICGTDTAQVLVYNRKWEPIRTINLASKGNNLSLVCAYKDGLILSAISGEATICIISPDDGRLVKVISTKEKPVSGLHSLPLGCIAMVTECSEGKDVCILDEAGDVTTTTHFHDTKELSIASDFVSDSFYIVCWGRGCHECTLKIMSSHGVVTAETAFKLPCRTLQDLNCTILASGKLVMNTSDTVLVYNIKVRGLSEMIKDTF